MLSQYVEPAYALRLLEERPERVGYLLKERVFDVVVLIDALRRLQDGESVVDPSIVARLIGLGHERRPGGPPERARAGVLACVAEGLSTKESPRDCSSPSEPWRHTSPVPSRSSGSSDAVDAHRRVLATLLYLRSPKEPTT